MNQFSFFVITDFVTNERIVRVRNQITHISYLNKENRMLPENQGANGQNGVQPEVSPPQNVAQTEQDPNSSAETIKTEGTRPFNEMIRNPEFQDYFDRQVRREVENQVNQYISTLPKPTQEEKQDIIAQVELELDKKIKDGTVTSKDIIESQRKVADHLFESRNKGQEEQMKQMALTHRINSFAMDHPDLPNYKDTMLSIFKSLPESEKGFIRNSDNGIDFLYSKAKRISPAASSFSNSSSFAGTFPAGRAQSSEKKTGGASTELSKAQEALKGGDRAAYERIMANIFR